jgi:hypothetical protein
MPIRPLLLPAWPPLESGQLSSDAEQSGRRLFGQLSKHSSETTEARTLTEFPKCLPIERVTTTLQGRRAMYKIALCATGADTHLNVDQRKRSDQSTWC